MVNAAQQPQDLQPREVKVVIVGCKGVGKSAIVQQLVSTPAARVPKGATVPVFLGDVPVLLKLVEIPGSIALQASLTKAFFQCQTCNALVVVYDVAVETTLSSLAEAFETFEELSEAVVKVLVGNDRGEEPQRKGGSSFTPGAAVATEEGYLHLQLHARSRVEVFQLFETLLRPLLGPQAPKKARLRLLLGQDETTSATASSPPPEAESEVEEETHRMVKATSSFEPGLCGWKEAAGRYGSLSTASFRLCSGNKRKKSKYLP